jgi:hypothetical protein
MAHVTDDGPADMILGTQLMMRIAEVTKGVYVGFTHRDKPPITKDMSKTQPELAMDPTTAVD